MYRVADGRISHNGGCEINAVLHCNLRCRWCDHLSPLYQRSFIEPARIERDLAVLARVYRPSYIKIIGGEPLLHPQLMSVIDAIRASGIAAGVSVVTNGTLLPRMPPEFWQAIQELWISKYPGHEFEQAEVRRIIDFADRFEVSVTVAETSHFRAAYAAAGTQDAELVRRIFATCQLVHRWKCHTVLDGHFFKCSRAAFMPGATGHERPIRSAYPAPADSGVALDGADDLLVRMLGYLNDREVLPACVSCLGSVGKRHPHEQPARSELLAEPSRPTEDLLDVAQLNLLERDLHESDGCVKSFTHWGPRSPWEKAGWP